ncbi:MAG: AAA family ATPase [Deltaproteobacteria bacterium]|nr:AAA family ATPase [Deltaproteobacteria bacterium]
MNIFIIVGMPASGKNIARTYAESQKLPYHATGDLVRAELAKRGIKPDPESMARISDELRGPDGMGVTRLALAAALAESAGAVFLEGMRSWPEIDLIRKEAECVVVAFLSPRQVRRMRVISRGRSDDSPDAFDGRDLREIAYGVGGPVAMADAYVLNTGSLDDSLHALDGIVQEAIGNTGI